MEEKLINYGYSSMDLNDWTKQNWTIRFDKTFIEVFNNPDKEKGKYFIGKLNEININTILEEIEDYLNSN